MYMGFPLQNLVWYYNFHSQCDKRRFLVASYGIYQGIGLWIFATIIIFGLTVKSLLISLFVALLAVEAIISRVQMTTVAA